MCCSCRLAVPDLLATLWSWHCTRTDHGLAALQAASLHVMTADDQQHPTACGVPSWLWWLGLLLRHARHLPSLCTHPQHALRS